MKKQYQHIKTFSSLMMRLFFFSNSMDQKCGGSSLWMQLFGWVWCDLWFRLYPSSFPYPTLTIPEKKKEKCGWVWLEYFIRVGETVKG